MTLEIIKLYAIKPTKTTDTNLCTNPSFDVGTTGFSKGGTNTIAVSTAQARRGVKSCVCTYKDSGGLITYSITLTAATYTGSIDIYIPTSYDGTDLVLSWTGYTSASITVGRPNMAIRDKWQRVHTHITPDAGDLTGSMYVYENVTNPTAGRFIYIDGVQIELRSEPSTYFDGDSTDCYWNGQANLSTSTRKATTRRGGTLVNLEDYLSISALMGFGLGPYTLNKTQTLSGRSLFQKTLKADRELVISGEIIGNNYDEIMTARQGLLELFKPDYVTGDQDVTLRYIAETATGVQASEPVDFRVRLRSDGLIGNWDKPTFERVSLVLECYDDPTRDGNNANVLGYKTTVANMANIMQRSADGVWSPLGTGLNGAIYAMAIHPTTGDLYIGGNFTNVNGTATTDYLVRWNGTAFVEVIASISGVIYALLFDASNNLYIAGSFADAGGVANADRICKWDGSTVTALGTGANDTIFDLAIDMNGNIYAGGLFTAIGGVANADKIGKWNGTAWSALGATPLNGTVMAVACDKNNNVYAGGNFSNAGGISNADRLAVWNGTAWSALSTGANDLVRTLAIDNLNNLIVGGDFTTLGLGGGSPAYLGLWNGTKFSKFGDGVNEKVLTIFIDNNEIFIGGNFTGSGTTIFPDRMAIWNGANFRPFDINVQDGSASIYKFAKNKYTGTLYVGGSWSGTDAISATVTASTLSGTSTYPKIVITGPGTIWQIKNYTNGKAIYFDRLTLLAGEVITLDFDKQIFNSTFRGNILSYIIEGISTLDFSLEPGSNNVSAYLFGSTTAASAITMTYKVRYWSVDEAKL